MALYVDIYDMPCYVNIVHINFVYCIINCYLYPTRLLLGNLQLATAILATAVTVFSKTVGPPQISHGGRSTHEKNLYLNQLNISINKATSNGKSCSFVSPVIVKIYECI